MVSGESHLLLPLIVAHGWWCSALALVCSASVRSSKKCGKTGGVAVCLHVRLTPHHHSPQCLCPSWRILFSDHASGFLFQPRVSHSCTFLEDAVFLLCSCHGEEMLSRCNFIYLFICRQHKIVCILSVKIQRLFFLKTQSFVFVGPGWNKNLYSAGAWGPELRTTSLILHTYTAKTHKYTQHAATHWPTAENIEVLKRGGTQHVWTWAPDATEVFIFYVLDFFFFNFCKQFLKKKINKQTSKTPQNILCTVFHD